MLCLQHGGATRKRWQLIGKPSVFLCAFSYKFLFIGRIVGSVCSSERRRCTRFCVSHPGLFETFLFCLCNNHPLFYACSFRLTMSFGSIHTNSNQDFISILERYLHYIGSMVVSMIARCAKTACSKVACIARKANSYWLNFFSMALAH